MATSVSTSPTVTQAPGNSSSSGDSEDAAPVEGDPGLIPGITKYSQLSPESKALDSKLYQRLLTLVTGPWSTLLYHVPRPLFSMAMFNLHKNQSMSGFEQKTEAMNGLAKLKFKGNPREFHGNFMGVVQDIYAAQCTIEDFIMMGYLNSFDQSQRQTRYEIASDINDGKITKENLYDFSAKYAGRIQTLGTSIGNERINNLDPNADSKCDRCGRKNHKTKDCRAKWHVDGSAISTIDESNHDTDKKNDSSNAKEPDHEDSDSEDSDTKKEQTGTSKQRTKKKHKKKFAKFAKAIDSLQSAVSIMQDLESDSDSCAYGVFK